MERVWRREKKSRTNQGETRKKIFVCLFFFYSPREGYQHPYHNICIRPDAYNPLGHELLIRLSDRGFLTDKSYGTSLCLFSFLFSLAFRDTKHLKY